MSPHRWVEHTSELELAIESPTEEAVFGDAFLAMRELLADGPREAAPPRVVELEAEDRAALLADWLGELAFLAESEGFVPDRLVELELAGAGLRAAVEGHRGNPPHLVKAATYHRLALEPSEEGWRATVILDV